MAVTPIGQSAADTVGLDTLHLQRDGAVLLAAIAAPPTCSGPNWFAISYR